MKNITRSQLEAIGQNWLDRRNKLLEYFHDAKNSPVKRQKAFRLSIILNQRIAKIIVILGQSNPKQQFHPGGIVQKRNLR